MTGLEPIFHIFKEIPYFSDNLWIKRYPNYYQMTEEYLRYDQFTPRSKLIEIAKM